MVGKMRGKKEPKESVQERKKHKREEKKEKSRVCCRSSLVRKAAQNGAVSGCKGKGM